MVNETFMVSGTAVGSHGEVVGIPVEANQGAQDDAGTLLLSAKAGFDGFSMPCMHMFSDE